MTTAHEEVAGKIAQSLLAIGAVELRPQDPFTWSSGLRSPIYCDNRVTVSTPEVRSLIADTFAAYIREHYPQTEVVAGIATGGIPHAALVADRLGLPMIYVRDKAKGHGRKNMIEGRLQPGQKVLVIEDLISTGGSSLKASLAIREAEGDVLAVGAIFTYQFPNAAASFAANDFPLFTLSNYSSLLDEAVTGNHVDPSDLQKLREWSLDPQAYSDAVSK